MGLAEADREVLRAGDDLSRLEALNDRYKRLKGHYVALPALENAELACKIAEHGARIDGLRRFKAMTALAERLLKRGEWHRTLALLVESLRQSPPDPRVVRLTAPGHRTRTRGARHRTRDGTRHPITARKLVPRPHTELIAAIAALPPSERGDLTQRANAGRSRAEYEVNVTETLASASNALERGAWRKALDAMEEVGETVAMDPRLLKVRREAVSYGLLETEEHLLQGDANRGLGRNGGKGILTYRGVRREGAWGGGPRIAEASHVGAQAGPRGRSDP